jgi:hypothetical protein
VQGYGGQQRPRREQALGRCSKVFSAGWLLRGGQASLQTHGSSAEARLGSCPGLCTAAVALQLLPPSSTPPLPGGAKEFLVRASYLEIYNEDIRDLLSKSPEAKLELKESPER